MITGAARGMGELYARRAVSEGARAVSLWDMDEQAVTALARELEDQGAVVHVCTANLSRLEEIQHGVQQTLKAVGVPDVIINNAGVVRGAPFWEHDPVREIEGTMRVNALAPMWLTRELLPAMLADSSRHRRILNVPSAAGTLANPTTTGMLSGKPFVLRPWTVKLSMALRGVLPVTIWDAVAGKVFGVYSTMDKFTGRESN